MSIYYVYILRRPATHPDVIRALPELIFADVLAASSQSTAGRDARNDDDDMKNNHDNDNNNNSDNNNNNNNNNNNTSNGNTTTATRDCPICLTPFELDDRCLRLTCGHMFHKECLLPWLARANCCAVCRCEMRSVDPKWERRRT